MTSADVDNCFLVLASMTKNGKAHIILRELKDFKADEWTKVDLIEPIGQSYPGVGSTTYYFQTDLSCLLRKKPGKKGVSAADGLDPFPSSSLKSELLEEAKWMPKSVGK